MLRLHSDTLLPLAFASFSNAFISSGVTRTRRNFAFDSPFGSFGLPGFLVFFASVTLLRLLYDGRSNGCLWRYHWRHMEDSHILLWVLRIVRLMRPGVNPVGFWVASQIENLDHPVPNNSPLKFLSDGNAVNMLRLRVVKLMDNIPQLSYMAH